MATAEPTPRPQGISPSPQLYTTSQDSVFTVTVYISKLLDADILLKTGILAGVLSRVG